MKADKLVGVLVSLLIALLLAWLATWRATVNGFNEQISILQNRATRAEEAEFWIKQSLERIEKKLEEGQFRNN